jgi:hypothetical protein
MTGAAGDRVSFWRLQLPATATEPGLVAVTNPAHRIWRGSGDSLAAIAPGGGRLAIADNDGHEHTLNVDASDEEIADANDELSFLGHQGPVSGITFSENGASIASAGADGTVRVWDALTGLPRPYYSNIGVANVSKMAFAPSGRFLAVLGGQRVWMLAVDSGAIVADIDLGEVHASMAFGNEDELYLGSESGTLRNLLPDRLGNWNLRDVWQGGLPLRAIGASENRPLLVIVDASNKAVLLDMQNGRLGAATLQLPDAASDLLFTPSNTRVLIRTSRWIHRVTVSSGGLAWLDALRAPIPLSGSQLVFDRLRGAAKNGDGTLLDPLGEHVLLLTRDAGFAEVAELSFSYGSGAMVFGTQEELLTQWRRRLALPDSLFD